MVKLTNIGSLVKVQIGDGFADIKTKDNTVLFQYTADGEIKTAYTGYDSVTLSDFLLNGETPSTVEEFEELLAEVFPDTEGGSGGSVLFGAIGLEIAATYAAINASTIERQIIVRADETNNGNASLYLHDGTTKLFVQTIAS